MTWWRRQNPKKRAFPSRCTAGDFAVPGAAEKLIAGRPDVIFHLAAIVSGEAELDFDKGYRINLDGTRMLLDAIRLAGGGYKPRLVFTSSIAVFGAPFPDADRRRVLPHPAVELRHAEGDRRAPARRLFAKGFLDGIGIRLPTICIRPGLRRTRRPPASSPTSCASRSPARKRCCRCPEDVRHWHATPRSAVGFLLHAATMDLAAVGPRRGLTMPGLTATVGEQIAALKRVAGDKVAARIKREPDPFIVGIVDGWPRNFEAKRARQLGFTTAEKTFDDIIRIHIEDELGGKFVA